MTLSWQTLYFNGQPLAAKYVEQLNPRRITVHRFELEPGSFRYTIPPSATTIIVKQQKEGWEDEFRVEIDAYERMKDVQGQLIPQLYGQGSFDGIPALILADVPGITLHTLALQKTDIEDQVVENALCEAFKGLHDLGGQHWDQKLDNFLFCQNDKVVIIDLEDVKFPEKREPWESSLMLATANSLFREFRDLRHPDRPKTPIDWAELPHVGKFYR